MIEHDVQYGKDSCHSLKKHVPQWSMEKVTQLLRYSRDWNTRARNSQVAMVVVRAVTSSVSVPKLASTAEIPELMAGIIPYAERHFDRLDKLISDSFLLDYTLSCMGNLFEVSDENWEEKSKYVLPPKPKSDNQRGLNVNKVTDSDYSNESENEIITVGDSDSDSDSDA